MASLDPRVRVRVRLHQPVGILDLVHGEDGVNVRADLSTAAAAGDMRQDLLVEPGAVAVSYLGRRRQVKMRFFSSSSRTWRSDWPGTQRNGCEGSNPRCAGACRGWDRDPPRPPCSLDNSV